MKTLFELYARLLLALAPAPIGLSRLQHARMHARQEAP
jgi:hypothetical protein